MGENLKKQLATTVRDIQWSYAIFWLPSPNDSRVLEWGDGYYNGGIKTRRTIQSMDLKADDQTISMRSDQLRELYLSLLSGSTTANTQARRPLAALSPEDLTNVEWFYLVCMSFVFDIGQGLPGRCLASGTAIWLFDAHRVDTTVFTRSLLAKSAGIKTVVCFPFLDGVIELGVTDLVEEDLNLIQHVRASLLGNPSSQAGFLPLLQGENVELLSTCGSSNGAELVQPLSDVFLPEGFDGVMENDQLSITRFVTSMTTSSDCISQTVVNPENFRPVPKTEATCEINYQYKDRIQISDQQGRISRLVRPISKDLHYQNALFSLFKKSDQGFLQQSDQHGLDKKSGFIEWKKGDNEKAACSEVINPQYMLKKILFGVPKMISAHLTESTDDRVRKDELCKPDVPNTNHVLAERRRREKVNERFSVLRSLIPSISKADKISILDDTIAYLKELERRVEELESCQESVDYDMKKKRKTIDVEEGTSDNYSSDMNEHVKSRRKGRKITGGDEDCVQLSTRNTVVDNIITISMVDKEILINISCPWRDNLLLQIIDSMRGLHLDSQSVHSSTVDDILSLKIQSKLKGCNSVSVELITQTLLRVIKTSRS